MAKRLDRETYDAIAALLQRDGPRLTRISEQTGVSRETVRNVWNGKTCRPPAVSASRLVEKTRVVAAELYDRIKAASANDRRQTWKSIAEMLGLKYGMVCDVLAGRARRGQDGAKRRRGVPLGKCPVCKRSGPMPCVYCKAKAEAAKRKRRPGFDPAEEIVFQLSEEEEARRAEMWASHLRAKASEHYQNTSEDAA
jgi:lambda repressor-like predicted transcriptional regulator